MLHSSAECRITSTYPKHPKGKSAEPIDFRLGPDYYPTRCMRMSELSLEGRYQEKEGWGMLDFNRLIPCGGRGVLERPGKERRSSGASGEGALEGEGRSRGALERAGKEWRGSGGGREGAEGF